MFYLGAEVWASPRYRDYAIREDMVAPAWDDE